jgi:hypothetical protein
MLSIHFNITSALEVVLFDTVVGTDRTNNVLLCEKGEESNRRFITIHIQNLPVFMIAIILSLAIKMSAELIFVKITMLKDEEASV